PPARRAHGPRDPAPVGGCVPAARAPAPRASVEAPRRGERQEGEGAARHQEPEGHAGEGAPIRGGQRREPTERFHRPRRPPSRSAPPPASPRGSGGGPPPAPPARRRTPGASRRRAPGPGGAGGPARRRPCPPR